MIGILYPFPEGTLLLNELLDTQGVVKHPDFMMDEDKDVEISPKDWPNAMKNEDPVVGLISVFKLIVKF